MSNVVQLDPTTPVELLRFAMEAVELLARRFRVPGYTRLHLAGYADAILAVLRLLGERIASGAMATGADEPRAGPLLCDSANDGAFDEQTCLIAKMVVSTLMRLYDEGMQAWEWGCTSAAHRLLVDLSTLLDLERTPAIDRLSSALRSPQPPE